MPKRSAGLLLYRQGSAELEVFLVHPGGPVWARKDKGAWSIPKGEYTETEPPLEAAIREFREETGFTPTGDFLPLGTIKQAGGKLVTAWAVAGDCDPAALVSNTCRMEWPPPLRPPDRVPRSRPGPLVHPHRRQRIHPAKPGTPAANASRLPPQLTFAFCLSFRSEAEESAVRPALYTP